MQLTLPIGLESIDGGLIMIYVDGKSFVSYEHAGDYVAERDGITLLRQKEYIHVYKNHTLKESIKGITPSDYLISLGIKYSDQTSA
jgi:hypothetical protein